MTSFVDWACKDGLCCNGRNCRHCGAAICRPENWSLNGFQSAVVCDNCWIEAAASWVGGFISLGGIARELNVNLRAVQYRFHRLGYDVSPSAREGAHRRNKRKYYRDPAKHAAQGAAWQHTSRGQEQMREAWRRHYRKEKEFANAANEIGGGIPPGH